MDSVNAIAPSSASRYQGVPRNGSQRDEPVAGSAQQQPTPSATTVTLSRRAQELASRQADDDARAATETQQATDAAEAAQEARRTQAMQAAEQAAQQADASSPRAQADAQLRRAYAGAEGSYAR